MYGLLIKNIFRFIILVMVQALLLNKINFLGYLSPYLYILFILLLPFEIPGWALLLLSFLTGLSIDLFTGTPGLHAAAATFTGAMRPLVIKITGEKPSYDVTSQPGIKDMGAKWFFQYMIILVLIHHFILNMLEVFSFQEFGQTLLRSLLSSVFTIVTIFIIQTVFLSRKEKV